MRHVFVYGTLREGEINDIGCAAARHAIAAPRWVTTAHVQGRLYDFGPYPGLVPDANAGPVRGEIYEIDDVLVPVLDEIEEVYPGVDGLFQSRETDICVAGERLRCLYYPVRPQSVSGLTRIECGDWVAYRRGRDGAPALRYGS